MPKYFYHGTTFANHLKIQESGHILPQSGKTYTDQVFLADNEKFASRVTFMKHAEMQGELIVVYKIHKSALKKKLLRDGSKHISQSLSFGDKSYCYPEPIDINQDQVFFAVTPYTLNLPDGVTIVRNGPSTGLSFTKEAAELFGVE